jgi:putative copper export protein
MADLVVIGVRALGFVAALQAAGVPLFLWLFGNDLERSARPIGAFAARTAVAGLLLTIGHQLVEPARLAGELRGIFDGPLHAMLLASDSGTAAAVRVLGLAMVAAGCVKPSRFGAAAALMGGALTVVSFAFMGHTPADDRRWLLSGLLILHLLLVAFWFGALWPLLLATREDALAASGLLIEQFSKLAIRLVPIILLAGFALSVALLPDLASLYRPYGLLLVTKVAGFGILMGLAALNKWRLGPRISRGQAVALQAFRRSVRAEWGLIAAVLTVTAVMTGLFSPAH